MKTKLLIGIVTIVIIIIGTGAIFFLFDSEIDDDEGALVTSLDSEESTDIQKPLYLEIRPPFVVTLTSEKKSFFLQVETAIMTYNKDDLDALEDNQPAIKSALVDLYSEQEVNYVKKKIGKDHLKREALKKVKEVMLHAYGKQAAEEIYFTKFVIQ